MDEYIAEQIRGKPIGEFSDYDWAELRETAFSAGFYAKYAGELDLEQVIRFIPDVRSLIFAHWPAFADVIHTGALEKHRHLEFSGKELKKIRQDVAEFIGNRDDLPQ